MRFSKFFVRASILSFVVVPFFGSCAPNESADSAEPIRLVDVLEQEWITGSPPAIEAPAAMEWSFTEDAEVCDVGWIALAGITDCRLESGRLAGRTATALPVLGFERTSMIEGRDTIHEVRIRARISAGSEIAVSFFGSHLPGLAPVRFMLGELPWLTTAPIDASGEMRTYVIRPTYPVTLGSSRYVLIRPSDAADAEFEIESIRLVSQREFLADIPSGIGWRDLGEHYRETVVTRSPERIRWPVEPPADAHLYLALGTLDSTPVTFGITVIEGDVETPLASRTLTSPLRWEPVSFDLSRWAGKAVEIELSTEAEKPDALGFWGTPAIRSHAAPTSATRATAEGAPSAPKHIIFVLADTLRKDHLEISGYERETMPHLTRLAAEGTKLDGAIAQGTWTKVSAASIFTGLYPSTHGVINVTDRLPSRAETLAESFRESGRATFGVSSVSFTGRMSNLHQGYEELIENSDFGDPKTARAFTDAYLDWFDRHRSVPTFSLLHYFDPHHPFEPRPPWSSRFADPAKHQEHRNLGRQIKERATSTFVRLNGMATPEEMVASGVDPESYIEMEKAWYDGSLSGMDSELGRVIERIRELGLERDTLIVFTSDHGEEFHEHGRMFHGQSVYGELANVPLVFWSPGRIAAGAEDDRTVQSIDIAPTLLELAGLAIPDAVQGRSLTPLLLDGSAADGSSLRDLPAIIEKHGNTSPGAPAPREPGSTAIVFEGWKLIHHHTNRPENVPEHELFDVRADPLDQNDLAAANPQIVERLAGMLEAWREAAIAAKLPEESAENVDPEELERLRALGYVQ